MFLLSVYIRCIHSSLWSQILLDQRLVYNVTVFVNNAALCLSDELEIVVVNHRSVNTVSWSWFSCLSKLQLSSVSHGTSLIISTSPETVFVIR